MKMTKQEQLEYDLHHVGFRINMEIKSLSSIKVWTGFFWSFGAFFTLTGIYHSTEMSFIAIIDLFNVIMAAKIINQYKQQKEFHRLQLAKLEDWHRDLQAQYNKHREQ